VQPKVGEGFDLPEGNEGWSDWTWFHARSAAPSRFTILCDTPVHYAGHFAKGRMVPCVGDACPMCAKGLGTQARYVFSVVEWETRRVGLLELGRGHALQVRDWGKTGGTIRGVSLELQRASHSKQSRIEVSFVSDTTPLFFQHLQGPDLARAVKSTWQRQASQVLHESLPGDVAPAQQKSPRGEETRRIA
jgi:hypothetical protein